MHFVLTEITILICALFLDIKCMKNFPFTYRFIGPAIVTTKDAGDALTLLQSLTSSTFDSSQLVLTACMGYQAVNETKLQELRNKHRPSVIAAMEERARGLRVWKDSKGLASKLYSFKHDPQLLVSKENLKEQLSDSENIDEMLCSVKGDCELDLPDLNEQVTCFIASSLSFYELMF